MACQTFHNVSCSDTHRARWNSRIARMRSQTNTAPQRRGVSFSGILVVMKNDPGAKKYEMSFEQFVQKVAAVPKEAIEAVEAQREKRPPRRRKVKPKAKG